LAINVLFAGIPVADLEAAVEWYERLLAGPPDMTPHEGERTWRLTEESWIYVVRDPERAGRALVTVMVDDLEERLAGLRGRGIEPDEIQDISENVRKAVFTDPEGNEIGIGQAG
jgi:catechol 2,3-dioxygenase-like lactoylglutathione lyase family enzyme